MVIRVNFLESQSWIKKAKLRGEIYSFLLEISSSRVDFDPCPPSGFRPPGCPPFPDPIPSCPHLGATLTFTPVCTPTYTSSHLAGHTITAWPDTVGQKLNSTLGQLRRVRAGKWGIKVALDVTEGIHTVQREDLGSEI